eukprot:CAMPEP_0180112256 /NCGR_PEP_ID=MMETSP0985-20121206/36114_1 /TAXON_ID=483367 /ORGANISM="non described non described, Strain CCMP 2436" /LENGTH=334 /DNA_ID=CAMNT_0022050605 /DNA_START=143 /DNA_END=1145 /DNA_ORIENTATION=-
MLMLMPKLGARGPLGLRARAGAAHGARGALGGRALRGGTRAGDATPTRTGERGATDHAPKGGQGGGLATPAAGQAKGGVSSLAMGTLHTPQQTQQQQQQTPGSTANPTPASALSCARSPFSAIASAAASSPRTPASASVAYWCLSATHERLGPFSQDELKGMWRKGAGRVQARPPGPGSAPPAAALAEAGEVDGDSIVWRAGWEGWKPLREAGSELPFVAMAGVASALGAETGDKGAGALRAAEPRPAAGIGGPMGPAAAAAAAAAAALRLIGRRAADARRVACPAAAVALSWAGPGIFDLEAGAQYVGKLGAGPRGGAGRLIVLSGGWSVCVR